MGKVLAFAARHARASAKLNKAKSTLRPAARASAERVTKYSGGTTRRDRQFDTAEGKTPSFAATAVVPPHTSINSSTVCKSLMRETYSQSVNGSRDHIAAVVSSCELRDNSRMGISHKGVKKRTRLVREALGLEKSEMADALEIARSGWVQFEDPNDKRVITLAAAVKLRELYGVSLDWLYTGDRLSSLPEQIAEEIRKRA